jgi:hypothetical protein
MTTSNQVSDLNATEPGTRSATNVHMMNRMAAAEEENLVLVVAEVMVVDNQLTKKMITIAAYKAMVEENPAMAVAENLVTDEMKVTDAGAVVGMVTNPSSCMVLDEEGMGVVVVDMERVGILRKDMGVDVDVVVERPDTRKTHMVTKRMALAVPLHKVCLLSSLFFHNSSLTRNLQPTHMHTSQLSHPRTTNTPIQRYSTKLRINFILVRISHPSKINI